MHARAGSHSSFLTQKNEIVETGLDYFLARYFSNMQGRFTSADPENAGADESDPHQRTAFDDLSDQANAVIFGNRQTAGLVDRAPAAGNAAVATYGVGAAIGITAGVAAYVAPVLATEAVVGLTSKAAARSAIERMAASQAAKAAAKRAVSRATTGSKIDIVNEGGSLVVRITRAGRNGYQVIESVIKSDGTKTVVQKAFDAAGKLVHYHPK